MCLNGSFNDCTISNGSDNLFLKARAERNKRVMVAKNPRVSHDY